MNTTHGGIGLDTNILPARLTETQTLQQAFRDLQRRGFADICGNRLDDGVWNENRLASARQKLGEDYLTRGEIIAAYYQAKREAIWARAQAQETAACEAIPETEFERWEQECQKIVQRRKDALRRLRLTLGAPAREPEW